MSRRTHITAALLITASLLAAVPARAKSVNDWEAMPRRDSSEYVVSFIAKMIFDLGQTNPKLAADIKDFFVRQPQGKTVSEGLWNLYIELGVLDTLAGRGKVDLSQIQIEGVIVKVVKDKFPPSQSAPAPTQPPLAAVSVNNVEAKSMIGHCDILMAVNESALTNASIKDFQAKVPAQQAAHLARLVERMAQGESREYIKRFFASEGMARVGGRLTELNGLAQQGKADLAKAKMSDVLYDVLIEQIDKDQASARLRLKDIDDRAIKLHDGRRAYIDGDGFRDGKGNLLQGRDLEEARQKLRERRTRTN